MTCCILLPSARQSASLFVQGLQKSERALLSRHVFLQLRPPLSSPAGVSSELAWRGESSPSCPQLLMHPAWLSRGRDGRHSTQLVKSTLMLVERNQIFISPPVRHLPISLEVREWHQLMTVGRRRHQHWHKNSMFQASGGIMRGLLLYRR